MQFINRTHFSSGQKLLSGLFNQIIDFLLNKKEQGYYMLRSPYESGLLHDAELPFNIQEVGSKVVLQSIAAITASGHIIRYKSDNRNFGPKLVVDASSLSNGNYYIYLSYLGDSIPWISSEAFGKTTREDIRVPRYSLELKPELQPVEYFPNSLLLGKVEIKDGIANIDRTFFPAVFQLGSFPKGTVLLDQTKKLWPELEEVTFKIYRDLRDVPRDSVFADTRDLAAALTSFLLQNEATVRHFNPKTSLFELFKTWGAIANIFRTYLFDDRLGVRPGDALQTLYAAATRKGEYEIENHFLSTIEACAGHCFDRNNATPNILLIEDMINYVIYSWMANYPIKLPNEKLISIQPNKF